MDVAQVESVPGYNVQGAQEYTKRLQKTKKRVSKG